MKIEIFYSKWHYGLRASRVEDEIRESFPKANVKSESGSCSDFIVLLDGKTIFEKKDDSQDFPRIFEITKLIKDLIKE